MKYNRSNNEYNFQDIAKGLATNGKELDLESFEQVKV